MSKSERQRPYNFGRVFFRGDCNPIPTEVRFQPLGNHVGNVVELVRYWKKDEFPLEFSFKRVLEAAKIHDAGKPQRFNIQVETDANGKFKKYIYSFRGHRYLAENKDAWTQALARGHHDFSVADITRDVYALKKDYADMFIENPLVYAKELYILEMCDQIEAELACRIIGDEIQAESRTFMDYTIASDSSSSGYYIDPWPFSESTIELKFESWAMQGDDFPEDAKKKLQKCLDENRDKDLGKIFDSIIKEWWQSNPETKAKKDSIKATLKPYPPLLISNEKSSNFWYQEIAGFKPNPMQEEMFKALQGDNPALVLKSATGSGKLESVLLPALAHNYRLFLPLPARSLLEDQKQRVEKYLKQFSKLYPGQEVSFVVDTGSQMRRWVYRNGEEIQLGINPRRHLYKGNVILTTIDKFLYRYFAFGDKQKSFIFPLRIHQEKTLICLDEAHSYEDLAFTNFSSLVRSLYEAGRSLVLMTATLPQQHLERFHYLDVIDYIDNPEKLEKLRQFQQQTLKQPYLNQRSFQWLNDIKRNAKEPESFQKAFAETITAEWRANSSRKIIAVVETVTDAAAIYQLLKKNLGLSSNTEEQFYFLYHGRIADQIRPKLYQKIQNRDEQNLPYLLITTSGIEVGCDLNSDVLISQICPPENLIQRVGRCNRKGNIYNAKVILIGDEIPDFANTLDEVAWSNYQATLTDLTEFDTEKIQACIFRSQQVDDYRVVEVFSMLHDYVYQADLTCQPLHKRGLIPTRSWTPSINLEFHKEDNQIHSISVPIDRFCSGTQYAKTAVYETRYDVENTRWDTEYPLQWGSAYSKEITVKIYHKKPGEVVEEFAAKETNLKVKQPSDKKNGGVVKNSDLHEYNYDEQFGFVDLPKIFIKLRSDGCDEKLLYQDSNRKVIITYTQALKAVNELNSNS